MLAKPLFSNQGAQLLVLWSLGHLFFFFEKSGYERKLVDQLWNSLNIKFALRGLYHMSHDIL